MVFDGIGLMRSAAAPSIWWARDLSGLTPFRRSSLCMHGMMNVAETSNDALVSAKVWTRAVRLTDAADKASARSGRLARPSRSTLHSAVRPRPLGRVARSASVSVVRDGLERDTRAQAARCESRSTCDPMPALSPTQWSLVLLQCTGRGVRGVQLRPAGSTQTRDSSPLTYDRLHPIGTASDFRGAGHFVPCRLARTDSTISAQPAGAEGQVAGQAGRSVHSVCRWYDRTRRRIRRGREHRAYR